MLLQSVLTKLAAAGLATKAAAGGAAVVVAASAAGAAESLPAPAQEAFDRLVAEVQVETGELPEQAGFGARVSEDATGESDGEPGVDGPTIACEASQGRSGACENGAEDSEGTEDANSAFGERVSQDATGESDGEPGVDGEMISGEARANNRGQGAAAAGNAPEDVPDDDDDDDGDDGEGGPEGTPGQDAVNTFRPDDEG